MTPPTSDLAATAKAFKRRHGDLLVGECSLRETTEQRDAVAALDAARDRLRGGGRAPAPQMALDLRAQ